MDSRNLDLFDKHFEIHGDKFEYANVRGIRWRVVERIKSIYVIPIGVDYTYELTFEFFNGAPLELGIGSIPLRVPFSMGLNKREFGLLEEKIKRVQAATLLFRLAHYREQIQREGFFEYDGKIFYRDGSIDQKGRRLTLNLESGAEADATTTKFKCLPSGSLEVSTVWDRDCFHAMLNDSYGSVQRAWPNKAE